ncbi:hypothetical protein [Brevundimonas sp. R86498]|uniref:hypothetical protein n=1 Tax=Brevundimonas sp. R86498 TaxID=3093845 RepID=UPI0037C4F341
MTDREQTRGREKNGAIPGGQPDAKTPDDAVRRTGRQERNSAGPDGPNAAEVGDTFKKTGG